MTNQNSYRQIVKASSIFGGIQVLIIIISIVRSKFIAILLGTEGIGIYSLLTSTSSLISGLTNFGLGTSAVKNVAEVNTTGDKLGLSKIIKIIHRLAWFTGLLGAVVMLIFSPLLSKLTFGNNDYTMAYIWISGTLLINQLTISNSLVLQGMRQINYMARSSLSGALLGLVVSLPIYFIWGIDGIVPSIIISSIVSLFRTKYFLNKIEIEKVEVSNKTTILEGKKILIMGFTISISALYVLARDYGLKAYIGQVAGLSEVGLFSAGMVIINSYFGIVFSAMGSDYYPKLSSIASDNNKSRSLMNQQAEIAVLILAPILTFFIIFIGWIVILLYSKQFLPIEKMMRLVAMGILFKATSWSMGFILLATSKSKHFLINEFAAGTVSLVLQLFGYYYWGLTGIGFGIVLGYIYHMFQVYFVTKHFYNFSFNKQFIFILVIQLALIITSYFVVDLIAHPFSYVIGIILILISSFYSFIELDKRIGIKQLIISKVLSKK